MLPNTPLFEMNKDFFADEYYAHNYCTEQNVPSLYLNTINIDVKSTFSHSKGIHSYLPSYKPKVIPIIVPAEPIICKYK